MKIQKFSTLLLVAKNNLAQRMDKPHSASLNQPRITSADVRVYRQYLLKNSQQGIKIKAVS